MGKPAALLPCPFCGTYLDSEDPAVFRETDGSKWGAVVCCIAGPEVRTGYGPVENWRDEAIAEWNKRTPPASPTPSEIGWRQRQGGSEA